MTRTLSDIDKRLKELIDECEEEVLRDAMAYSVFAGGKRFRPRLVLACCEAAAGRYDKTALDFACAAEMIHTYSLIHDDLPAMDDDDFRRGKPTCHKIYGEATAILAGDGLLSHAFFCMARQCEEVKHSRQTRGAIRATLALSQGAGVNGMVAGQTADMVWEDQMADEEILLSIHSRKTAALISACAEAGACLGGGVRSYVREAAHVGYLLGLAFQIMDDILDVTAEMETLGKPIFSDVKNRKNTYVTLYGLEKAQAEYGRLSAEIFAALDTFPQANETLRTLAKEVVMRNK